MTDDEYTETQQPWSSGGSDGTSKIDPTTTDTTHQYETVGVVVMDGIPVAVERHRNTGRYRGVDLSSIDVDPWKDVYG